MRQFLLRIEPVIWLLFGQGLLIGTMLLTGWIAVVGIAIPLGWLPSEYLAQATSFDRAHALASHHDNHVIRKRPRPRGVEVRHELTGLCQRLRLPCDRKRTARFAVAL